ncbi:phosphoribosylglycinamide formyltransferase [Candidatus Poribacteria bacterium]|nr:phosphoribosylglycinamide formyltransferase [Candidatus Poribacteria bacterium]
MNIAILISGSGTNLQSIINEVEIGNIPATISLVISNMKDAYGLVRAKKHNIPTFVLDHKKFQSREDFDKEMVLILKKNNIDLVVLAGFMRVISPYFVNNYRNRIINIHPAILPSFPGTHAQKQAFDYGVKYTGCTVHFIDEGTDTGPIILQAVVPVNDNDTSDTLASRILEQEHKILPLAIKYFVENKLVIQGRKVFIKL